MESDSSKKEGQFPGSFVEPADATAVAKKSAPAKPTAAAPGEPGQAKPEKKSKPADGGLPTKKAKKGKKEPSPFAAAKKKKEQEKKAAAEGAKSGGGSAPGVNTTSPDGASYTLAQMQDRSFWESGGDFVASRWKFLEDCVFEEAIGVDKAAFEALPKWKQTKLLKKHNLF